MIDINKNYRTRDGLEVRIYATDGQEAWPTHGAVLTEYGWSSECWNKNGSCLTDKPHGKDLIEVRPRHKRTVWLTVWSFNYIQVMSTPEWQISKSGRSGEIPYACIKVELDYEEGEGL
jgi:hypothetical protein